MFVHVSDQRDIGVGPDQVVAVIESLNAPHIAIPGLGAETTKAYIVGIRLPQNQFRVLVFFHLLDSNAGCVYGSSAGDVALEGYADREMDAIGFTESMGFMLDNLNFLALAPDAQLELVSRLPFFPLSAGIAAPAPGPAPYAMVEATGEFTDLDALEELELIEDMPAGPVDPVAGHTALADDAPSMGAADLVNPPADAIDLGSAGDGALGAALDAALGAFGAPAATPEAKPAFTLTDEERAAIARTLIAY